MSFRLDPVAEVVAALEAGGYNPRPSGPDQWSSRCPVHQGGKANLVVSRGSDGRVLTHCFHSDGCGFRDVLAALNISPARPTSNGIPSTTTTMSMNPVAKKAKTIHATADRAIRAAKWTCKAEGDADWNPDTVQVVGRWPYHDANGNVLLIVVRFQLADGSKSYSQVHPVEGGWNVGMPPGPRPIYRVPEAMNADRVYFVEGEKAADAVVGLGLVATTTPGGATVARKADLSPLRGRHVAILPDNDVPGREYAAKLVELLAKVGAASVKAVELPGLPEKGDICDWLVAANAEGKTKEWCRCELERLAVHPVEPTPAQRVEEARREIVEDNSEIEDDPTMDDILAIDRGNEGRPSIEITCEQTEVNDQAIAALARDPNVFTIGGKIAVVAKMPPPRGVKDSPDGFKRICILDLPALEERMSASAYWHTSRIDKKGEVHQSQELPPGWSVKQVFSRPHKAGIPQVEGMVETPVLRPDGSIHETPGYDPATWTFFSPNAEFLPVPDAPTREDAIRAKDVLLELVTDFPFKDDANRAVWLAAALTPIARPAITEACPAFVFDAPEAGTGKSKLCDLISIIASGTEMPRSPWPGGRDVDDEVRKTLTAIAISGDRFTLWDNVPEGCKFGCASLDNAVTSITYKARVLGSSKLTDALPWRTITYATGNNMTLGNDTVRRTLISRIEADVERPCDREGFVFPRLIAHAKANRAKYVQAALTILKAHAVAGRPQLAKELGSFEEWSTVVASAVAWVMGVDPISVQKAGASRAPATSNRKILFDGLLEVNADVQEFTAADMLTKAEQLKTVGRPEDGPMYPSLYEFVEEFLDLPSRSTAKRKLFAALEKNEGKVVGGHKLVLREGRAHSKLWRLTEVKDGKTRPEEPSDESQMVSMVNMVTSSRRSIVRENSSPVFSYGPAGGEAHHAHHAHHLTPVGRSAPTCGDQAQPFQQATALPLSLNASGLPYDPNDWTTFG